LPKKAQFDTRRANFRKFILRRLAAELVKNTSDCNVVFIEDLESNFDSDNDDNALTVTNNL